MTAVSLHALSAGLTALQNGASQHKVARSSTRHHQPRLDHALSGSVVSHMHPRAEQPVHRPHREQSLHQAARRSEAGIGGSARAGIADPDGPIRHVCTTPCSLTSRSARHPSQHRPIAASNRGGASGAWRRHWALRVCEAGAARHARRRPANEAPSAATQQEVMRQLLEASRRQAGC